MWEKIKNKRLIVLLVCVWTVLVGALVGYGINSSQGEPKFAGEESLVSVRESESNDTSEPLDSADSLHSIAPVTDVPSQTQAPVKQGELSENASPGEKTDSGATTALPVGTVKPATTVVPARTPKPEMTTAPVKTPKPKATASPTDKPKDTYILIIECTRILDKQDMWIDGLEEVIPADGYIYKGKRRLTDNESVYDALKEACEDANILMDSRFTPLFDTYYVSGIGNLYEFDCGSESGWKYMVNDTVPGIGSSLYTISPGDVVVWFYDYKI